MAAIQNKDYELILNPISMSESKLTPIITIDVISPPSSTGGRESSVACLEWIISGTSKLVTAVNKLKLGVFINRRVIYINMSLHKNEVQLHMFYSLLTYKPDMAHDFNGEEIRVVKGLATRSLYYFLTYLSDHNFIDKDNATIYLDAMAEAIKPPVSICVLFDVKEKEGAQIRQQFLNVMKQSPLFSDKDDNPKSLDTYLNLALDVIPSTLNLVKYYRSIGFELLDINTPLINQAIIYDNCISMSGKANMVILAIKTIINSF